MAKSKTITFLAHDCWIIRSTSANGDVLYAESYKQWNRSPAFATVFRDYEAAHQSLWVFNKYLPPMEGEVFDIVPLYGALLRAGRKV